MVVGTAALGILTGIVIGAILAFAFGGRLAGWDTLAIIGVGVIFGYPLGIILGQLITYKWRRYPGSLPMGIAGVIVGAAATLGIAYLLYPNVAVSLSMPAYFVLTPLAGAAGYHLRSRPKLSKGE